MYITNVSSNDYMLLDITSSLDICSSKIAVLLSPALATELLTVWVRSRSIGSARVRTPKMPAYGSMSKHVRPNVTTKYSHIQSEAKLELSFGLKLKKLVLKKV